MEASVEPGEGSKRSQRAVQRLATELRPPDQVPMDISDDEENEALMNLNEDELRVLQKCLFVHKFSGNTNVDSLIFISLSYGTVTAAFLATQIASAGLTAPSLDLKTVGLVIFLVGITGNGYHHWLLANLRKEGDKRYVVPQGGLFSLLVCPHYVFEMITFVGIAFMSQTVIGWSIVVLVVCYLTGRSISSKQWYLKKVDGFPKERSVLIPGVF